MRLKRLSLTNFRNYLRLEWDTPPGVTILQGGNAQGKTNLLEAIYFLATAASPQAEADRQLINWEVQGEDMAFARLTGEMEGASVESVEMVLLLLPGEGSRKEIRVNGVRRRASDLLGLFKVVLFRPQDVDLIAGSPGLRRRYLDELVPQIERGYGRALLEYERILLQRNHLLRRMRERGGGGKELEIWDERLVERGSQLIASRLRMVAALEKVAQKIHGELTGGEEDLRLFYKSSLPLEEGYQLPLNAHPAFALSSSPATGEAIAARFQEALRHQRRLEVERGMTLVGPHRDDLRCLVGDMDLTIYGSRGQQRTCALSLRLAQVRLIQGETGEQPVLLLDDVMSELDQERRRYLLAALREQEQAIITATQLTPFPPDFLEKATLYRIVEGRLEGLSLP